MATNNGSLPGPDNITRTVLENGITVLVYENHAAQSVVIAGSVRSGSIYEDRTRSGLAGITADALMRGTQHRDFEAINESLESIGADVSIDAGVHKTGFNGKALGEDLPVLIDILGDVLRYPSFPTEQVERLRGEIMVGLQYRQQDTRYRASRAFRENLYPIEHPYHHSTSGTLETVPTITIDEMQAFHRKHYGPDGMVIVIVGDVNTKQALDIVRERLGDWRNADQPATLALPSVPPVDEIRRVSVTVRGKTQSDIVMGVPGPSRYAADYQAANLANSILGQFGMMGRIGKEVREKLGLAYYAYSRVEGGYGPNPWSVSAGVNPANVQLATDSIVNEIRRLATERVSDEDIDDNKSYFTGHLPLQLENNEGIAGTILSMESYDLGLDYLLKYRDMIKSLTKADLLAAAQHYWNPEAFVLAVAGPDEG